MQWLNAQAEDSLWRRLGADFRTVRLREVSQEGSHVKLRRVRDGQRETLTIAMHRELDRGTLHAIFRQALHIFQRRIWPRISLPSNPSLQTHLLNSY